MLYAPSKRISPNCDTALPILVSKAHAIILVPPWHRNFLDKGLDKKKILAEIGFQGIICCYFCDLDMIIYICCEF